MQCVFKASVLVLFFGSFPTLADDEICDSDEPMASEMPVELDMSDVILTDKKGMGFTDLHMLNRQNSCLPRTPKLDLKTLRNAKLACMAKGGRLPMLSEVNNLATHIAQEFFLDKKSVNVRLMNARFMKEEKYFWTASLKKETNRFVYNRALTRVSHLKGSTDLGRAEVIYEQAEKDNEYRPFLCVFPMPVL